MRDWGGKAVGAILRITALLHGAQVDDPTKTEVSSETVFNAIKIMDCLETNALSAYQDMGADKDANEAKYVLKRLKQSGKNNITKSDLFQSCRGQYKKIEEMDNAIKILEDSNYIKISEQKNGQKGRPSTKITLNPYYINDKAIKSNGNNEFLSSLSVDNNVINYSALKEVII